MIFAFLRKPTNQAVIDRLHGEIMAAARQPALYLDYGVADTFEGRFEALALLATIPVRRLAQLPAPGPALAQQLTDTVFTHFDDALRELGTSDVGVPKKIKKLAAAWLGRRGAYAEAMDANNPQALAEAIARNVYAGAIGVDSREVQKLLRYSEAVIAAQAKCQMEDYMRGPAPFPDADRTN